jgi:hypothetical protein
MSFILIMGDTPKRTPLLLIHSPFVRTTACDQFQTEILSLIKDRLSPSNPVHICERRYLLRSNSTASHIVVHLMVPLQPLVSWPRASM